MQVPLRVFSADGKLMAEFGEKKRIPLKFGEVPERMVQAFLSAEDDRFFEHPGVDYQGILRAAGLMLLTGKKSQGGSTITMQVARNFFLSREKTFGRKLTEILLSFRIERELSKEEILELYLNKIYLGNRAYGVGAAAQVYYGKEARELSLPEIAMIAGLPKAPSKFNPIVNPQRALERRDYVLGRMRDLGFIPQAEYEAAVKTPGTAEIHGSMTVLEAPYVAEMVRHEMVRRFNEDAYTNGYSVYTTIDSRLQDAAQRAVRSNLRAYDRRHGYIGPERHLGEAGEDEAGLQEVLSGVPSVADLLPAIVTKVEEKGAQVYVKDRGRLSLTWEGLEWARQRISEDHRGKKPKQAGEIMKTGDLVRVVEEVRADGAAVWSLAQVPKVQSAMVSVAPDDGAIKALVGGYDFYHSKFNRVTQAKRQPGSGFKAMIYSAALEAGFTPASLINDAPVVTDDASSQSAMWRPENYSGEFGGPTRLRIALAKSRNLVSIRILRSMGIKHALEHIRKFGYNLDEVPHNLTMALGTGVVTPLDMARAYSVFANGGFLIEPYVIQRIEENGRGTIFKANPVRACETCVAQGETAAEVGDDIGISAVRPAPRVISPQNSYLMNSMMQDVIRMGTATDAKRLGRKDLAGKTGTTNDQRDAWFNGFHPSLAAVVWVGNDDFDPLGEDETGGKAALPVWIDFMAEALKAVPEQELVMPAGMYRLRIDPESGRPAPADQKSAITEVFQVSAVPPREGEEAVAEGVSPGPVAPPVEKIPENLF
ncbi:MAG: penicillin-binding protein 1A [Gammaproteobacteria bacterium]|nr:penicillin-binding protein 1A [Gammaproteobacteria bacterium]MBU1653795.1 penicillin-binding protein 1A [Gammaproteobacteria bacterium]MBU1961707.1 penicillin-binding protein 1A [Gammaproteobacteria bacterium]